MTGADSAAAAPEPPPPARRTVMIVDDDPALMEMLVRVLQRESYDLLTASSGPNALHQAALHEGRIDLLITDHAMPEMKGRDLADRMREKYPDIRVLYQTGDSVGLFEHRMELEHGAAFLQKPFSPASLREAARMILSGRCHLAGDQQL
jgi:CheY-like chemotaxis protein